MAFEATVAARVVRVSFRPLNTPCARGAVRGERRVGQEKGVGRGWRGCWAGQG